MGLSLDTSILIDAERRGERVDELLMRLHRMHGETVVAISAISMVEMTHGIYRVKNESARERRRSYAEELYRDLPIHPLSLEIALLAGRIEGQEAAHQRDRLRRSAHRGDSSSSWISHRYAQLQTLLEFPEL